MSVETAINIPSSKNLFGSIKLKPEPSKLKMRILLIAKATIPFERNAIMFLSSSLKKEGYEVKAGLLDYSTAESESQDEEKNQERIYKLVKDFKPHVVGYSCMTGEHYYILKMNALLKKDFNGIKTNPKVIEDISNYLASINKKLDKNTINVFLNNKNLLKNIKNSSISINKIFKEIYNFYENIKDNIDEEKFFGKSFRNLNFI